MWGQGEATVRNTALPTVLEGWWRQPDRYDWVVQLVENGGYGRFTRSGVAASCAAIGAWPLLMVFSAQGVTGTASRIVTAVCGVLALIFACWWVSGWPTCRQSKVIVVMLNATIAVNCVLYVLEDKAVTGTLAFALTASYVACVHTLPHLTVVLAMAVVPIVLSIVTEALAGDPWVGLADGALRLASVIVVPMSLRTLVQLLGDTAVVSDIDPLTGLANRRGLFRALGQLVGAAAVGSETRICMTMIDIDDFKSINDTHGHTTGDQVLVALAHSLRRACPGEAVIARIGGEEFAIVTVGRPDDALQLAENLRLEFRETPANFTASIGIATSALAPRGAVDTIALTEHLLDAADQVMYAAKRAGGDRVEIAR
jgi:diguanylate cyclase (GGDEF)-like protein